MARYIDVEGYRKLFDEEYKKTRKLISEGETHLDNLAEGFSEASRVIDRMPAADVAPKSELAKEFTCFVGDPHKVDHCPYLDEIEKAKTEVAREIFEEIERQLNDFNGYWADTVINTQYLIAELKKKYTGE